MADDDGSQSDAVCKVFDKEDGFTSFVQAMLAVLALASLYLKRQQERPRRKFWTWAMDVSKQAFGACYAHVMNMVIAAILADNVRGGVELEDECAWYAINYVIDCTLGLVLSIAGLKLLDWVANDRDWVSLKHSGVYHGRQGVIHWINQLLAWIVILTVVKVIVCFVMWLTSEWLAYIGAFLFAPLQGNIRFELLFVMIFFPGIMNIIYFWITDSYLKAKGHHHHAHESMDEDEVSVGGISMSHSFDIIDTGGMAKEGLLVTEGLAVCGGSPMSRQSVRESAIYDPKTEQLITKKHYEELYGKAAALQQQQQQASSTAGVSSITNLDEGTYTGPTLPENVEEGGASSASGGAGLGSSEDPSKPQGTLV